MPNIWSDVFTYAGTATLGVYNANYIKMTGITGDARVNAANVCYLSTSSTNGFYYKNSVPPSADYTVSADVIANTILANNRAGVAARVSSSALTMYQWLLNSSGVLTLVRFVAGTQTQIGTATIAVAAGSTHRLEIKVEGDQISGYVDGMLQVGPVTDTGVTAAGYPGFMLQSGASAPSYNAGLTLDNFSADTIESGAVDATATGGTGTSTGSGSGGSATGATGGDASATGGTGTGTGSGSGGSATGGTAGSATITLRAIDFTTSELRVSETGVEAIINELTGALVVRQTGLAIDASGNCPVTSAALTSGTTYRCTTIHSDGSEGTWRYTAV